MRNLGGDDATEMKGMGFYQGTDGKLYQWVEGVDARGDAIGFWQGVSQREDPVLSGLGALYQAPDGTLYQTHGLAEDEEAEAEVEQEEEVKPESGEDRPTKSVGARTQRRRRFFRRRIQRPGPAARRGAPRRPRRKGGFFKKLLPIAKFATRFIPGIGPVASAGLDVAGKLLKRKKGVSGYDGLGYLYAAPDGSLYQVQGLAEEEELNGFADEEELRGLDEDEELRGLAEEDELRGIEEDQEELRGFAEEEEDLRSIGEDQDMPGVHGYVRQDGLRGMEAYVPQAPPQTPWHVPPAEPPEIWKPLW